MKCKFCGKELSNKSGLSNHENHCKNNPNRKFFNRENVNVPCECKFCGKKF